MERKYTRYDAVIKYIDELLLSIEDGWYMRQYFVHLYGVSQLAFIISMNRGNSLYDSELAAISGLMHDVYKLKIYEEEDHGVKGSVIARNILNEIGQFTGEEIDLICNAIANHSNKDKVDNEFDEILKDADAMHIWLRNPVEKLYVDSRRIEKVSGELQFNNFSIFDK